MCDGLCICCDEIMIFVRKIDETGPKRSEDAFHQSLRFIGRSVLDDHLEENTKVFEKIEAKHKAPKRKQVSPLIIMTRRLLLAKRRAARRGGGGRTDPKRVRINPTSIRSYKGMVGERW